MEGVLPAVAIPFKGSSVDAEGLLNHALSLIKAGVDGFFALGTTGQGILLNVNERRVALEALRQANPRYLVVQVGSPDWDTVTETVKLAERLEADAIATIPPIYYRPDYETLRRYLEKITGLTSLPLYIYNIPQNTGFNVTPELAQRLIKDGVRLGGFKDSTGDLAQIMGFVDLGLSVFNGADRLIVPSLIVGAKGTISALANSVPELVVEAYRAFKAGDMARAMEVQRRLSRLRDAIGKYPSPAVHYSLVKLLRYDFGSVKEPLVRGLSSQEEASLASELRSLGFSVRV